MKSKQKSDLFINTADKLWRLKKPKRGKLDKDHYHGPFKILKLNVSKNAEVDYGGKTKVVHTNKLFIPQHTE